MNVATTGAGVKDWAYGLAVLAALAGVAYVIYKIAPNISKGAGYLFGSDSAPSTLGTDLYDALHPNQAPPSQVDLSDPAQLDQAIKTCRVLYPPGGSKVPKPGSICDQALNR